MTRRNCWLFVAGGLACLFFGCDGPRTPSTPSPAASPELVQPAAGEAIGQAPGDQVAAQPPAAAPEMVREQATVGVGKRGGELPVQPRALDIITTPTNVYFRAQEQVIFNIQIPQAMDLYKASEGHPPESEKEFFDNIIKANNIKLPELPPGHKYVFDVKQQQLMVEHPK